MAVHAIKIPSPGGSITAVGFGNWLLQDGGLVLIDESLCVIVTDSAPLPLVAGVSGRLLIILEQGSVANVGDVACSIDSDAAGLVQEDKSASKPSAPLQEGAPLLAEKMDSQETGFPKGHPSPAARKMIEERGLETEQIEGTGPGGRILKQDVPVKQQEFPKEVQSNKESVTAEDNPAQEGSDASRQTLGSTQ
jgi:Pyruvate/2-oxoglutarate dehydrogenase complex, dihydrolipoamide acyltransferase (E2) component, and related enzymes